MTTPTLLERARDMINRYRTETPLGHQPHMIAGEADELLADLDRARSWTKVKPTKAGAYYVRGYTRWSDAREPGFVEIIERDGALICNLHQNNTDSNFDNWYPINELNPDFEWFGPLPAPPIATESAEKA